MYISTLTESDRANPFPPEGTLQVAARRLGDDQSEMHAMHFIYQLHNTKTTLLSTERAYTSCMLIILEGIENGGRGLAYSMNTYLVQYFTLNECIPPFL